MAVDCVLHETGCFVRLCLTGYCCAVPGTDVDTAAVIWCTFFSANKFGKFPRAAGERVRTRCTTDVGLRLRDMLISLFSPRVHAHSASYSLHVNRAVDLHTHPYPMLMYCCCAVNDSEAYGRRKASSQDGTRGEDCPTHLASREYRGAMTAHVSSMYRV